MALGQQKEVMSSIVILPSWVLFIVLTGTVFSSKYLPFDIAYVLTVAVILGWVYLLGSSLSKCCKKVPIPLVRLKIALGYAAGYAITGALYFVYSMPSYVAPFHMLAMFSIFYSFYFVAKSLLQAEREKGGSGKGTFVIVIMVWFFPIGVWFLQPRVKRVLG